VKGLDNFLLIEAVGEFIDQNLRRLISDTARDSGRVFITPHAKKRMRERKITLAQVLDCLRNGLVSEPAHANMQGNWQCTMTR